MERVEDCRAQKSGVAEDRRDRQTLSKPMKLAGQRRHSPTGLLAANADRIWHDFAIAIPRILMEFVHVFSNIKNLGARHCQDLRILFI